MPYRLGLLGLARVGLLIVAPAGALTSSCGGSGPSLGIPSDLVQVSGETPFPSGCNGAAPRGTLYRGAAVEPFLAVDPRNSAHLIGVWQQDRWSNTGANGLLTGVSWDSGRTWNRSFAPFSRCAGGNSSNGGDFERASDPWVAFSSDGTVDEISLSFSGPEQGAKKAILVSRSTDGGLTWGNPAALARDEGNDVTLDKESITADPTDARFVYAVWDRLTELGNPARMRGPTWFARMVDGAWEPAGAIYDPGPDAQTIANQIIVLPDGTLLNGFLLIAQASAPQPERQVAVLRSTDKGMSWSSPVMVERSQTVGVVDAKGNRPIRSGAVVPEFAADPVTGRVYAVWQDARFSGGARDGIALSTSPDGGSTWSRPIQLNRAHDTPAFTPSIAISSIGEVGITYYDFRSDDPNDRNSLRASYWLATSSDQGATWMETEVGGAFDIRTAPFVEGYFVGDYEGLAHNGESFIPFFSAAAFAHVGNATGIFARPLRR